MVTCVHEYLRNCCLKHHVSLLCDHYQLGPAVGRDCCKTGKQSVMAVVMHKKSISRSGTGIHILLPVHGHGRDILRAQMRKGGSMKDEGS